MVKVKICGNQSKDNVDVASGADAAGFIVSTPESSREISPGLASRLADDTAPFTSTVAVTTESDPDELRRLVKKVKPDSLQVHTQLQPNQLRKIKNETPETTDLITLLPVAGKEGEVLEKARNLAGSAADALLLDSKSGESTGGTGETHDWSVSAKIRHALHPFPVILAGGLAPDNVGKAIRQVRPYGVDVASGVEDDGQRSNQKVKRFLEEVRKIET
jgi:phosphoribosylanthranilate isomerase